MRFWWVNQNKTYRHEVGGGYLWSPKRKANGTQNPFYDFMREVSPGDVVFSFADTRIRAIGIARSFASEAPKPSEFGPTGAYWDQIGWRVDVQFSELQAGAIRPAEFMAMLGPLLPRKYAPLQPNGSGLQNLYLTRIDEPLAALLIDLIGSEARDLILGSRVAEELPLVEPGVGQLEWEDHEAEKVREDDTLGETDRLAILLARRGQGVFRQRVMRQERCCRVTGVTVEAHLRASHCKPWRDATNEERLDGANGLLLTPNVDHLFDRGFIGFEGNGNLIIAPVAVREALWQMGIPVDRQLNVGAFSDSQRRYLDYHRENVLLRSNFLRRG